MVDYRKGSHTVYDIKYYVICTTKYRYKIINKAIESKLQVLLVQGCETMGITIVKGHTGEDHVHLLLSCPTNIAPCKIVQYLKGRSSKILQDEFPELKKRYWGQHLWAIGYFCATVGTVNAETIKNYIENQDNSIGEIFKKQDE